jgi:hypothetical protein
MIAVLRNGYGNIGICSYDIDLLSRMLRDAWIGKGLQNLVSAPNSKVHGGRGGILPPEAITAAKDSHLDRVSHVSFRGGEVTF